jgi:hypothetical protein
LFELEQFIQHNYYKLMNLRYLLYFIIEFALSQPCASPTQVVSTPITGYCVADSPTQLVYSGAQMGSALTGLSMFTIVMWFRPDLKASGRTEQALFRIAGDPSDVTGATTEGVRLGLFFTANLDQNTVIRLQYSKTSTNA